MNHGNKETECRNSYAIRYTTPTEKNLKVEFEKCYILMEKEREMKMAIEIKLYIRSYAAGLLLGRR